MRRIEHPRIKFPVLPEGAAPEVRLLLVARGLRAFGDGLVSLILPVYLLALGYGAFEAGVLASATLAGSALLTLVVGLTAHRASGRVLLMGASVVMLLTGIAFAVSQEFWPLLLVAFVGTLNPSSGDVSVFLPLEQAQLAHLVSALAYLREAAARLSGSTKPAVALWRAKVGHYEPLIERVIAQSERRVLCGEAVPAGDKLVSLFETHADIIVKGSRDVQYGHKLNLTTGRSGLILDLVIEAGNPADSDRLMPMLERHISAYGAAPLQAAADGGFASRKNLDRAKACGVRDMAFHKKSGLSIEDMVRSRWVYRKLRNFRAGIEAGISCLKRAYGLARCTWRGLDHFKAYVWSSVVAYNLVLFTRLKAT